MSHYRGLQADTVKFRGHNSDQGEAYYARPSAAGKYPGIVVIHHLPGWDEWIIEVVRKLTHHGYAAISPHLYFREGSDSPDDIGARVRAAGGVADAQVMGDVAGAMAYLRAQPNATGKIGVIGFCSGGRHTYLAACTLSGIDAAVDCWGGNVIVDNPKDLNDKRPVAPIDLTEKLNCPLLGIFGNDDAGKRSLPFSRAIWPFRQRTSPPSELADTNNDLGLSSCAATSWKRPLSSAAPKAVKGGCGLTPPMSISIIRIIRHLTTFLPSTSPTRARADAIAWRSN
jgi:carboxymethylenebutenolidase